MLFVKKMCFTTVLQAGRSYNRPFLDNVLCIDCLENVKIWV